MKQNQTVWVLFLMLMLVGTSVSAQTDLCDKLEGAQRDTAMSLLKSQRSYDCCTDTVFNCLSKAPECPLAKRLADDICRRAEVDHTEAQIGVALSQREASVTGPRVEIDVTGSTVAGDPDAPMEIVEYVCIRCPYCSISGRYLHESVTSGKLKGKAKLYMRSFILRNHEGATAGAAAAVAAEELGKFWEMLLYMFEHFDEYDTEKLPDWAASLGMDADRFRERMDSSGVRQKLIESQKEGIRNGVESTPTIFVNRRRYQGDLALGAIVDFVEGEYDRLAGQ